MTVAAKTMATKTIGLVGGLGWASTALYYRFINEAINTALGGVHSARIFLDSHDQNELATRQAAGDWDGIERMLARSLERLESAGADFAIVACNTIHRVLDGASRGVKLPVLHIADVAGDALVAAGRRRVALLGTRVTMEDGFYAERLCRGRDLTVLLPEASERAWIGACIRSELIRGDVGPESVTAFVKLLAKLAARGADAVLLACTELSLLRSAVMTSRSDHREGDACESPLMYDSAALHARAAAVYALPTLAAAATVTSEPGAG